VRLHRARGRLRRALESSAENNRSIVDGEGEVAHEVP